MYDLNFSYTFHFRKKNTESSLMFLRNEVLILNGKKNREAAAIWFEIRIPKKKNKELLQKVPSKIHGSNFIIIFWFVHISKYHHGEIFFGYKMLRVATILYFVINVVVCWRCLQFRAKLFFQWRYCWRLLIFGWWLRTQKVLPCLSFY